MIGAQGRNKNSPLCLLLLAGFGLAFAVLGVIYLTAAVGVTSTFVKHFRTCMCDEPGDPDCMMRYPELRGGPSASGRNYNSTSASGSGLMDMLVGFESITATAWGNKAGRQRPNTYEEKRKKECRNLDREFTAGYLAIIVGLLQFALVIPSFGADTSSGGKSLVLMVFLGLMVVGTITVCSCILHVYVDVTEKARKMTSSGSQEVIEGFIGATGSIIGGNAITYSLGYFALILVIVQIGAIVMLAMNPSPPPIMSMP